jgi:hypothetical protein
MTKSAENSASNFESISRPAIAFYAALVGFGLKRILDIKDHPDLTTPWFLIGVALFLRFLTGSSLHLTLTNKSSSTKKWLSFCFDLLFLMAFGVLASLAASSSLLPEFFHRCAALTALAVVWFVISFVWNFSRRTLENILPWWPWMVINLIHTTAFLWAYYHMPTDQVSMYYWTWSLFGITTALFLADLIFQAIICANPPPWSKASGATP